LESRSNARSRTDAWRKQRSPRASRDRGRQTDWTDEFKKLSSENDLSDDGDSKNRRPMFAKEKQRMDKDSTDGGTENSLTLLPEKSESLAIPVPRSNARWVIIACAREIDSTDLGTQIDPTVAESKDPSSIDERRDWDSKATTTSRVPAKQFGRRTSARRGMQTAVNVDGIRDNRISAKSASKETRQLGPP
jgi:hypothetical protein